MLFRSEEESDEDDEIILWFIQTHGHPDQDGGDDEARVAEYGEKREVVHEGDDQQQHVHKDHDREKIRKEHPVGVGVGRTGPEGVDHFKAPLIKADETEGDEDHDHGQGYHLFDRDEIQ